MQPTTLPWPLRLGLDLVLLVAAAVVFWLTARGRYQVVVVPEACLAAVTYAALLGAALAWPGLALFVWRIGILVLGRRTGRLQRDRAGRAPELEAAAVRRRRRTIARRAADLAVALGLVASKRHLARPVRQASGARRGPHCRGGRRGRPARDRAEPTWRRRHVRRRTRRAAVEPMQRPARLRRRGPAGLVRDPPRQHRPGRAAARLVRARIHDRCGPAHAGHHPGRRAGLGRDDLGLPTAPRRPDPAPAAGRPAAHVPGGAVPRRRHGQRMADGTEGQLPRRERGVRHPASRSEPSARSR